MTETVKQSSTKPKDYIPLAKKIAKANKDIGAIAKDGNNRYQNYGFQSESAIKAAVQRVISENYFSIIPNFKIIDKEQQTTSKGNVNNFVYVQGTFTITDGVETLVGSMPGTGSDTGEKAVQKACTSAQKYFYKQLFNITDKDEDPDAQDSNPGGGYRAIGRSRTSNSAQQRNQAKSQTKSANLRDYKVNYNGQLVPMYLVVKHASEGNQKAQSFANNLKGKDLEVFTTLAKNGVVS